MKPTLKTLPKTFFKVLLTGCILCFSTAVPAGSELLQLLEILRENGTITEAQYRRLVAEATGDKPPQQEKQPIETVSKPEPEPATDKVPRAAAPKVTVKDKLQFESDDGRFKFRIGARIHIDGAHYSDDVRDLGGGAEIRRAELDLGGTLWQYWDFELDYDFTESGSSGFQDTYIRYTGFKPTLITIGNFNEPFSLEQLSSSNAITFMERALSVTAFAPAHKIGVGVDTSGERWGLAGGFFVDSPDADNSVRQSYGVAGRLHGAHFFGQDDRFMHLGIASEWRKPDQTDEVSFDTRPESHQTSVQLVDTGDTENVDHTIKLGVEAAGEFGPFSVQGEYIRTRTDRDVGPNLDFSGWYLYGSYILTGESRRYDPELGTFGGVKPKHPVTGGGGLGAWEIALRYSHIDLNNKDIKGGREKNLTVGVNWYTTANPRFMFNYIKVDSKQEGVSDDPQVFQVRAQVNF